MRPRFLVRARRAVRSAAAVLLLPLGLGVSVPEIRWCGIEWSDVWLACAVAPEVCRAEMSIAADASCGDASSCTSQCAGPSCGSGTVAVCGGDSESSDLPACPLASAESDAMLLASHVTTETEAPTADTAPGQAYCIDDPPSGPTPRVGADALPDLVAIALPPSITAIPEPPLPSARSLDDAHAPRPPTEEWATTPPVRGPPVEETT